MQKIYLNGDFIDANKAKISPMDRGFLFGEGIYEVIPTYHAKTVGLRLHMARFRSGLAALDITITLSNAQILDIITTLVAQFNTPNIGVYLHVSRGADVKRHHAYSTNLTPTIFAYAYEIAAPQLPIANEAKGFTTTLALDLRWKRCHIKSTSLLGNVMHFQQGKNAKVDETILYNDNGHITEASSCNVFIVKDEKVYTPPLSNELLSGVTRQILIDALKLDDKISLIEQNFTKEHLLNADEVWITSSSKQIGPVLSVDEQLINKGEVGPIWEHSQRVYDEHKFSY